MQEFLLQLVPIWLWGLKGFVNELAGVIVRLLNDF